MTALASLSPDALSRAEQMDNDSLIAGHQEILRARRVGSFIVTERSRGLARPFYGCADLPGACTLEVVPKEKESHGDSAL